MKTVWFDFRFTTYNYNQESQLFVPIEFDYYKPYTQIIETYKDGVKEGPDYEQFVEMYGK
jgi:hypothetical protein